MTEQDARAAIEARHGADKVALLDRLVALTLAENARQNLIAAATEPQLWTRHLLDSSQLVDLAEDVAGPWLDIGTGGGFPGLVVATLRASPAILVEPRARRAAFLRDAAATLGLANVTVHACKVERVPPAAAAIISARAVAALPALFAMAATHATATTRWVLPKGRSAQSEVAQAQAAWHGVFHVKPSMTDPDARIVVAEGVRPR